MAEVNLLDEMARVEKAGLVSTFLGKPRPPHNRASFVRAPVGGGGSTLDR